MPLYFTDKKRRWPPSKPTQYILAILALILALVLLIVWINVGFGTSDNTSDSADKQPSNTGVDLPGVSYCLVVIEDPGSEKFSLVCADPTNETISIASLSSDMALSSGSLASVLQSQGISKTAEALADTLALPLSHYLSFSISDAEKLLIQLGNPVLSIPEDVAYKDENGATVRLPAGQRSVTPAQVSALLRYTGWENRQHGECLLSALTVTLINTHLTKESTLKGYFELLSNTGSTNWRIDHYNEYLSGMQHLISANKGELAKSVPLSSLTP